ncbi:MAG: alginate lyase family protein [Elusimicrobia bacterium]|nr:alginate lyase family protein [Elusimicrobiota bacterium]
MIDLGLYYETARHLRPRQWLGRLAEFLPRPSVRVQAPMEMRPPASSWILPAERAASMTGPARARLLNRERDIASPAAWNDPSSERLWLYHLHYFDDLCAQSARTRNNWHRALIARWIEENPGPAGAGWEPYPIARRVVNWIKWALAGNPLDARSRASLAAQAGHLEHRLETRLLGNHLLADAKALMFAGAFLTGPDAERCRTLSERLLREQWDEQILPDGGHFERSPMYHALILEDALDILNLARAYDFKALAARARAAASLLLDFLPAAMHPDGEIAFFNDSAFGMAPAPRELFSYASRLGFEIPSGPGTGSSSRPAFGLWAFAAGATRLIVDAGAIGPDYLPGHAHCDTLSYELSVGGRRVVVNCGTYSYAGPERARFRRTRAHNTVEIDGEEQHEIWADFRVARRGYPYDARWCMDSGSPMFSAAHTGYMRLPGRPLHRRTLAWRDDAWMIEDLIEASGRHAAAAFVHFHPDARVLEAGPERVVCASGGRRVIFEAFGAPWRLEEAEYSPEFGLKTATRALRQERSGRGGLHFGHRISVRGEA